MTLRATLVDICLPCYLTHGYNGEGEYLVAIPLGLTLDEAVEEAFDDCTRVEDGPPESYGDEEVKAAVRACLTGVNMADPGPVLAEGEEPAYVYIVLRWEVEEDFDGEPEDMMDGDHASALASCGWGTDEDYM